MVVYHAINYSAFRPVAFRYLAFLPPTFILIAGFLVGQTYASKYDPARWALYGRLLTRGLKLVALFTVCNVLLYTFEFRRFGLLEGPLEFAASAPSIYFVGTGRVAIFEVLLPIAYFLIAAPLLVYLTRFSRWFPSVIAVAILGLCVWLERRGVVLEHLNLFSAGILGMALGAIPIAQINGFASRWWPAVFLYLFYRVGSYWLGERFVVQTFGVCATLLLIYSIALPFASHGSISRHLVKLGQYSLFAYFVQIAVLQILVRLIVGPPQHAWLVLGTACVTLVCTVLLVTLAEKARAKFSVADTVYKAIFA
jgi:hypothetical protein